MEKKRDQSDIKTVRFPKEDWAIVVALSTKLGISRSEFIKRATMREAGLALAGAAPHYQEGPRAIPDNGGANTFSNAKQTTKRGRDEHGASAEVKPKPADARKKPTTTVRR